MQRILRDDGHAPVDLQLSAHRQGLIHRYCPPSIGNLFAIPRKGRASALEWWTELPGHPRRLDELNAAEQTDLEEEVSLRFLALKNLITELERRGDPAAAELRELPTSATPDTLYSVGGEPLLIRWVPIASSAKVGPSPAAMAAAPRAPAPTPPPSTHPRRRRVLFLSLPLLGLLALLGLWLGFNHCERFTLPWLQCPGDVESLACRDANIPRPEFVTIFDTSGSMNLHISATHEDEEWYFGMPDFLRAMRALDPRIQRLNGSPSRLDIAKDAFTDLVRAIDPAVDIGLVTYRGCEVPVVQGRFTSDQRPAMARGVRNLVAIDGTPLAASLQKAASMVDGKERDAVILAFVDGADGCGRDQCAVARNIARQQPRLRVNVVDISNSGLSDCIAEQTGGRVFGSRDADDISDMLKDAGRETLSAAHCPD